MSRRYPQVKTMRTPQQLRGRLDELQLDLPVVDEVHPDGPLADLGGELSLSRRPEGGTRARVRLANVVIP